MTSFSYQPASAIEVSVIIPCRNERDHIAACLTKVLAFEAPPGGFEVIVADGMSDDGTREILARLVKEVRGQRSEVGGPRVRIINNPGRIVSNGLNAAIRAARGNIIIRLDAHTEYAPDYLLKCLEIRKHTGADNVGGPAGTKVGGYLHRAIAVAYHLPFSVGGARFHNLNYEGYVDTVTYGCWHRSAFEKFGYFDEELVRNQDDEHNLRIVRGGGRIYQSPKIKSWYRPRSRLSALFHQYLQYGYWKVRVIQKHKLPASWRHLVPGALVMILATLFLLSAISLLLSLVASNSQLAALRLPISIFSAFSFAFLSALTAYITAVLAASLHAAARTEWKLVLILPFVFPCYHFGYGIGFLHGVLDFVFLRRGASASFTKLTRLSPTANVFERTDR